MQLFVFLIQIQIFILIQNISSEIKNNTNSSIIYKENEILSSINLLTFNLTDLIDKCDNYKEECYTSVNEILNNFTQNFKKSYMDYLYINPNRLITKIISESYYYYGLYNYYGINSIKTNLEISLSSFIISSYLGNPKSQYKIYILLTTDLINHIINSSLYKKLLENNKILNYISTQKFYSNFNYSSSNINYNLNNSYIYQKSFTNSIALQFLYSSALSKYYPALLTLGYQFSEGILVEKNLKNAINYYKQSSYYSINSLFNKTNFYYYHSIKSLEKYEYIKYKFEEKDIYNIKVEQLIDEYKTEQNSNNKIKYISEIGLRYLLGVGTSRNYEQALAWFELGSKRDDSTCQFYLGEMYLNGYGTEINYKKAYEYFIKSTTNFKNSQAYNSLGYMYYYGLYVEKNINKAYEYFLKTNEYRLDNEGLYNIIALLMDDNNINKNIINDNENLNMNEDDSNNNNKNIINNNNIIINENLDFELAYKYSNFISLKKHKLGSYFFAMLNKYKMVENINPDFIILNYFKYISEKFYDVFFNFNYANNLYLDKKYQNALLFYMELAEQGIEKGIVNTGIILKKYKIFKDKKYQNFLFLKYTYRAAIYNKDLYSILNLGDYFYYNKNYTQALHYYINVIKIGENKNNKIKNKKKNNKYNFHIANGLFNIGYMTNFYFGNYNNKTEFLFNLATKYENSSKYPIFIINFINMLNKFINHGKINEIFIGAISSFFNDIKNIIFLLGFIIFYLYFTIDIYLQK